MTNWKPYVAAAFLFIGCGIVPLGWMFDRKLWFIGFALIMVGSFLMVSAYEEANGDVRHMFRRRLEQDRSVPGDIHGYSGWGSGGRSTSWREEHSGGADHGDLGD